MPFQDLRGQIAAGFASLRGDGPASKSFVPSNAQGGIVFTSGGSGLSHWTPGSGLNFKALAGNLWDNSAVAACLNWIITAFPEAVPTLFEQDAAGKLTPAKSDPLGLRALLSEPNPAYDDTVLWAGTLISLNVDGNAYWFVARDGLGNIKEIWYTPHFLVEPKRRPGSSKFIDYYEYRVGGIPKEIDPEDVIHFRFGVDPFNIMKGMAPLKSVTCEVFTDKEATLYCASVLKNLGIVGALVTPDGDNVTFDPDEFVARFKAKTTGDKRGEVVAYDVPLKLQTLDTSPEKMALDVIRKYPEARIAAVMGIPPILAGLNVGLERSTFANYEQARQAGWEDNLLPTTRLLSRQGTRQLVRRMPRDNGKYFLGFDTSNVRVLQPDADKLSDRWRKNWQASLATRAECRAGVGLPFDEVRDNVFYSDIAPKEPPPNPGKPDPTTKKDAS